MQTRNALTLLVVAAVAGGLSVVWTPPRQAHSVQADITTIPEVVANPLRIPTLEAEVFAAAVRTKDGKSAVQVVAIAPPERAGQVIPLSMSWTRSSFNQMSRVPMPAVVSVSSAETSLVIGPDGRAEAIVELAPVKARPDTVQAPRVQIRNNLPPNGVNRRAFQARAIRDGFTLGSPLAEAPVTLWAEPELADPFLQFQRAVVQQAAPTTRPEQP